MFKKISLAISTVTLTSLVVFAPLQAEAAENSNTSNQEMQSQQKSFKNAQGKYDFNKGPNTDTMPIQLLDESSKQKIYDLNELKQNNQISQYEYNERASKIFNQYLGLEDDNSNTNSQATNSSNQENNMNSNQQEILPETGAVSDNNAILGLSFGAIGLILVIGSIIRKKRFN